MAPAALVLLSLTLPLRSGTVPETLADARLTGGLAVFVDPDSSRLDEAAALSGRGEWVVHLLVDEPAGLAAAQKTLETTGRLGRNLYVSQWDGKTLPHADHLVDFVAAGRSVPRAEVLRVLSPLRGFAMVGDETLRKPALEGSDNWTHRLHGPGNNPVSRDTAFRMPAMLQYLGSPMQTSFQGSMLVEDGVRYEFTDWVLKKPDRTGVAGKLLARNQYNGLIFWVLDLPANIEPDEPISAVAGGILYLASGERCEVLRIDGATGKHLPPMPMAGDSDRRVRWLAIEDGRLHVLMGDKPPSRKPLTFVLDAGNKEARAAQVAAGQEIACHDLATGKVLWTHREPSGTIDYRLVATHRGQTFFYNEATHLRCIGPDGRVVWTNNSPDWLQEVVRPNRIRNWNIEAIPSLMVGDTGFLAFSVREGKRLFVFSTDNGNLLSTLKPRRNTDKSLIVDGKVLLDGQLYDPASGTAVGSALTEGGGCGFITWVPGLESAMSNVSFGAKSPCGVGAFSAGGVVSLSASQCDCWPHLRGAAGFMFDNGLLRHLETGREHPMVTGAATASEAAPLARPGDWVRYRGDTARRGALVATPSEPTIRWIAAPPHPFDVSTEYDRHTLDWPERPTPPVVAGPLTVVAGSDGWVRAMATDTGDLQWSYPVHGPVFTAPEIAHGRVYVPGGDGWVHCLDGRSGTLIWKWRGAPAERSLAIYGKLVSSWPVTSVLVEGDTLYGVAGQWMQNGTVAFALDSATGKPRWTHWTAPDLDSFYYLSRENPAYAPSGYLTLMDGKLHVRTALGFPASFHATSGERILAHPDLGSLQTSQRWTIGVRAVTAGSDLIGIDDRTLLGGGTVLLLPPAIRQDKSHHRFVAYYLDESGRNIIEPLARPAIPSSLPAPSLEGGDILLVGGVGRTWRSEDPTEGLRLWDIAKWRTAFETVTSAEGAVDNDAADADNRRGAKDRFAAIMDSGFALAVDPALARWNHPELMINALALGPKTAVAVVGEPKTHKERLPYGQHPGFAGWSLRGFDRATGELRWQVDLPGEPLFNALAGTADGAILLTLRDGSVVCVR